ncbi:hypothetical protein CALCODRAFT_559247 [Calocera cornea HHB12733]|uniref:Uncharacterized protein n=1 Tax=Calocera cornea HHB12733 TaxID=1353952 RepID=A0A165C1G0_9BASI|nr:hypothetical protein CALCODRAFT_559247 [Calocera cornea HHB12733]
MARVSKGLHAQAARVLWEQCDARMLIALGGHPAPAAGRPSVACHGEASLEGGEGTNVQGMDSTRTSRRGRARRPEERTVVYASYVREVLVASDLSADMKRALESSLKTLVRRGVTFPMLESVNWGPAANGPGRGVTLGHLFGGEHVRAVHLGVEEEHPSGGHRRIQGHAQGSVTPGDPQLEGIQYATICLDSWPASTWPRVWSWASLTSLSLTSWGRLKGHTGIADHGRLELDVHGFVGTALRHLEVTAPIVLALDVLRHAPASLETVACHLLDEQRESGPGLKAVLEAMSAHALSVHVLSLSVSGYWAPPETEAWLQLTRCAGLRHFRFQDASRHALITSEAVLGLVKCWPRLRTLEVLGWPVVDYFFLSALHQRCRCLSSVRLSLGSLSSMYNLPVADGYTKAHLVSTTGGDKRWRMQLPLESLHDLWACDISVSFSYGTGRMSGLPMQADIHIYAGRPVRGTTDGKTEQDASGGVRHISVRPLTLRPAEPGFLPRGGSNTVWACPELVGLVCLYLSPSSLAAVARVNRMCNGAATRVLYRQLSLDTLGQALLGWAGAVRQPRMARLREGRKGVGEPWKEAARHRVVRLCDHVRTLCLDTPRRDLGRAWDEPCGVFPRVSALLGFPPLRRLRVINCLTTYIRFLPGLITEELERLAIVGRLDEGHTGCSVDAFADVLVQLRGKLQTVRGLAAFSFHCSGLLRADEDDSEETGIPQRTNGGATPGTRARAETRGSAAVRDVLFGLIVSLSRLRLATLGIKAVDDTVLDALVRGPSPAGVWISRTVLHVVGDTGFSPVTSLSLSMRAPGRLQAAPSGRLVALIVQELSVAQVLMVLERVGEHLLTLRCLSLIAGYEAPEKTRAAGGLSAGVTRPAVPTSPRTLAASIARCCPELEELVLDAPAVATNWDGALLILAHCCLLERLTLNIRLCPTSAEGSLCALIRTLPRLRQLRLPTAWKGSAAGAGLDRRWITRRTICTLSTDCPNLAVLEAHVPTLYVGWREGLREQWASSLVLQVGGWVHCRMVCTSNGTEQ